MKFFTEKWASGELSEKEAQMIPERYRDHLDGIASKLSYSARTLAYGISLHDGLIQKIQITGRNIEITMIVGDLQAGYHTLKLVYVHSRLHCSKQMLNALKSKSAVEIIYDEIDLGTKTGFIHRMLTSELKEIQIDFADLSISLKPRSHGSK